jgi:hypothetical protein
METEFKKKGINMFDDKSIIEILLEYNTPEKVYQDSVEIEKNPYVRIYYRNLFFQAIKDLNINLQYTKAI